MKINISLNFSVLVTMLNVIVTSMLFMSMFDESFVPKAFFIFLWGGLIVALYWLSTQLGEKTKLKGISNIFYMTFAINIVQFLSSFLYEKWTYTEVFSPGFMMKACMGLVTFVIVWITFVLIQGGGKTSHKTYNARIGEEEKETFLQSLFNHKPNEKPENDVTLILGVSRDKEQQ